VTSRLRLHKIVAVIRQNEYVRHGIKARLLPIREPPRVNIQRAFLTSPTAIDMLDALFC
jgi:hypothetical protein